MDLNYLYHRKGVSHLMAQKASCDPSRRAHLALASAYGERIVIALSGMKKLAA